MSDLVICKSCRRHNLIKTESSEIERHCVFCAEEISRESAHSPFSGGHRGLIALGLIGGIAMSSCKNPVLSNPLPSTVYGGPPPSEGLYVPQGEEPDLGVRADGGLTTKQVENKPKKLKKPLK